MMLGRNVAASAMVLCASVALAGDGPRASQGHPIEGLRLGPDTTVVSEPLNPLGYPDYVAVVDQEYGRGVATDENFWALFVRILPRSEFGEAVATQLATHPGFETALEAQPRFVDLGEGLSPEQAKLQIDDQGLSTQNPWKAADYPRIVKWLETNEQPLQIADEASRRPKAYMPLTTGSGPRTLAHVLLPHVQKTRSIARALNSRAMLRLGEGRSDEAWADVLTMHRIASHLDKSVFMIERLVGMAIRSMSQKAAILCLADPNLEAAAIEGRWRELARLVPTQSQIATVARVERLLGIDLALALRSGAMTLDDVGVSTIDPSTDSSLAGFLDLKKAGKAVESLIVNAGDVNEMLIYVNSYYDGVERALERSTLAERRAELDRVNEEFELGQPMTGTATVAFLLAGADGFDYVSKRAVLKMFAAAFGQATVAEARTLARVSLIQAAMAAELHFRQTGQDVQNGDELLAVASELALTAGIPAPELTDPYTGGPWVVRRTGDGLTIYCFGENQKDDGGKTFGEGTGTDDISVLLKR